MDGWYPEGIDCGWLGSDENGHAAIFTTAGYGPVPTHLANRPYFDRLEIYLDRLPERTTGRLFVPTNHAGDFCNLAALGLFVFDWQDVHRPLIDRRQIYEAVAAPAEPVNVDDLPPDVANMAAAAAFELAFREQRQINVRAYYACCEPSVR
jgi:hypothetical protein